jgi:hypothetical protein
MEKKLSLVEESRDALQKRVNELEKENKDLKIQLGKVGMVLNCDSSLPFVKNWSCSLYDCLLLQSFLSV